MIHDDNYYNEVKEKISEIEKICNPKRKAIFRGECGTYEHPVSSTIFRNYHEILDDTYCASDIEKENFDRLRETVESYRKATDIKIYTDSRHVGIETASIDFSENMYIAIFFACNGFPENLKNDKDRDGVIWIHHKDRTKAINSSELSDLYVEDRPIDEISYIRPIETERSGNRVKSQQSILIHVKKGRIDVNNVDVIKKVIIPYNLKEKFLQYLDYYCGISHKTIYNDIDGFKQNKQNFKSAYRYFYQGMASIKKEKYNDAIEDHNKAIELDPTNAWSYYNRGYSKSTLGRHDDAIEDYNKAIELDPTNAWSYYNRGYSKSNLGRHDDAIEDYNNAIELEPTHAWLYNNRGYSKSKLGRYDDAIEDYNNAIELEPTHAWLYNNRGYSKSKLGRRDDANEDYKMAVKLNST